jgi:hypothetical protein
MTKNPEVVFNGPRMVTLNSGLVIKNIHEKDVCASRYCPIHNPSDHELRGYPLYFNGHNMYRVVDGTPMIDPDDYYFAIEGKAILRNSIICTHCGDMVESTYRHHMAHCSCRKVAADGGLDYLRRLGGPDDYIETAIEVVKADD